MNVCSICEKDGRVLSTQNNVSKVQILGDGMIRIVRADGTRTIEKTVDGIAIDIIPDKHDTNQESL